MDCSFDTVNNSSQVTEVTGLQPLPPALAPFHPMWLLTEMVMAVTVMLVVAITMVTSDGGDSGDDGNNGNTNNDGEDVDMDPWTRSTSILSISESAISWSVMRFVPQTGLLLRWYFGQSAVSGSYF